MGFLLTLIVHLAFLLLMPPLLLGVINRTKAFFAGRVGPPLLQPYFDLARLFRKGMVISTTTTWMFQAGPLVTLAAILASGLLLPFGRAAAPVSFAGDLVLFIYLFALARFFTTAAALDTGSPFEGMGAAREVTLACLAEPAVFLALLVLSRASGALDFGAIFAGLFHGPLQDLPVASLVLVTAGLFIVLLAENCRIPVDDPNTHLELTMIHEVMVLDHSGPLLGVILYGSAVKLFVLGALLLHVVAPFATGNAPLDWLIFAAEMLGLAVLVGVVESMMARLRMPQVPTMLIAACLLCGFAFALVVR